MPSNNLDASDSDSSSTTGSEFDFESDFNSTPNFTASRNTNPSTAAEGSTGTDEDASEVEALLRRVANQFSAGDSVSRKRKHSDTDVVDGAPSKSASKNLGPASTSAKKMKLVLEVEAEKMRKLKEAAQVAKAAEDVLEAKRKKKKGMKKKEAREKEAKERDAKEKETKKNLGQGERGQRERGQGAESGQEEAQKVRSVTIPGLSALTIRLIIKELWLLSHGGLDHR